MAESGIDKTAINPPHTSKPLVETFGLRVFVSNLRWLGRLPREPLVETSRVTALVSNLKGVRSLRRHSRSVTSACCCLSRTYPPLVQGSHLRGYKPNMREAHNIILCSVLFEL